jgi:asparagine synthase (glutamine-hydrolysing)
LLTFSAVSPDGDADRETSFIHAASTMHGLDSAVVSHGELDSLPELEQLTWDMDEPFDASMTLVRAVYIAARQRGLTMLLDGVSGDTVLSQDRRLARLLRAGRWRTAYREAAMANLFWGGAYRPCRELLRSARQAFVPDRVVRPLRPFRQRRRIERRLGRSLINQQFGRQIAVGERLERLDRYSAPDRLPDGRTERAQNIDHPFLTVGRERYDRVAGAVGIEPRDPFLDLRVLSFCISLPDEQVLVGGWPKAILRRATLGLLPDEVRWRRGREHLGWAFTAALMEQMRGTARQRSASLRRVNKYVDPAAALRARKAWFEIEDAWETTEAYHVAEAYHVVALAEWLERHERRPAGRKRRT